MDRLIWDAEVLSALAVRLQDAAQQLSDSRDELIVMRSTGMDLLEGNGPRSERILDQLSSAIRRIEQAQDKGENLAIGVRRVQEMFQSTEASIQRMAEADMEQEQEHSKETCDPLPTIHIQPHTIDQYVLTLTRLAFSDLFLVPRWLEDAAEAAMR